MFIIKDIKIDGSMEYQITEPIPEIYISKENSFNKERLSSSKIFWQLSTQEVNTKNIEPTETPSKNIENNELKSYLTFGGGTFIRGSWQPFYPFFGCNAWRVCFEKLEGINIFPSFALAYSHHPSSFFTTVHPLCSCQPCR